ncbi:ankyrin repeat domain-containing protein [Telluria aromaticivorans]|uniref:Ankyrin repeat domain-containing protein n=1 Tax=Telluria aromaticivorans TaxID=2725995 RepID=A0A7Y2JUU7_9BURK|nr:ankyrin repeat domain-containing protein [Telluria aromaticivorans]NNG21406.1 ankyrin repeat domain-containing protein [Telluria aromaticivorans]
MARYPFLRNCLVAASLWSTMAVAATPAQVAAFFRAVQLDDVKKVEQLVGREVNANEINPVGGEPALVIAVREDAMRVLNVLLAHPGTDLEAKAMNGNTALMMAAFKGNKPAAVALLAKGAQVNRSGWTALHYAAASGDGDIARMLIERKARLDALSPRESGAYTPLMMAAREGKAEAAMLLLGQGANPRLENTEGLTAARIAERAGHTDLAAAISAFKR